MQSQFKEQQGFLTFAQNTDVDYLRLAYLQALSVKLTMPTAKYAVIVDEALLIVKLKSGDTEPLYVGSDAKVATAS